MRVLSCVTIAMKIIAINTGTPVAGGASVAFVRTVVLIRKAGNVDAVGERGFQSLARPTIPAIEPSTHAVGARRRSTVIHRLEGRLP
jgi:hypothetical protein